MNTPTVVTPDREVALAQGLARHVIQSGTMGCYVEPAGASLNHLFFLRVKGRDWVGRKTLQRDAHQRLHLSSVLTPFMLLGPLVQWQWSNEGVSIYFRTATLAEKTKAFDTALALSDSEVNFPFPLCDDSNQEAVCPDEFWQCNEVLATQLNADEAHFRDHCVQLLKTMPMKGQVIYDPACSTGEFISHLARELTDYRFLASDRSASMIAYAKNRHVTSPVEFRLLDSSDAAISGIQCDVLILRFLNAEVLTRSDAHTAFRSLVHCVKPGGNLLIFGHTPVLIPVPWLAQQYHLHLLSSVAARSGQTELFQFYRLLVPTS